MKKSGNTANRISLAVAGVVVLAIVAGLAGGWLGTRGAADSSSGDEWLEGVTERGELRVGVAAFAPMVTQNDGGDWEGPVLLPLQSLADSLGVDFTPVPTSWANIVAGLMAGNYDIAAGLDITPERALSIQFTDPYYEDNGVWVVLRDSDLDSTQVILDSGETVAESQGTAHEAAVKAAGFETLSVDSWANAIQTVKAGRAVAQFSDYGNALGQVRSDDSLAIVVPEEPLWLAPVAYGVPVDIDPHSLQAINISIRQSQNSGERDRALKDVDYIPVEDLGDLRKG